MGLNFVEGVKRRYQRPPMQKEPLSASLLQELLVSLLTRSLNRHARELEAGLQIVPHVPSRKLILQALLRGKDFDVNDNRVIILFQKRKNDQRKHRLKVVIKSSDLEFSLVTIFRQYLLRFERNSNFSGESFILPAIKDGRYVCSKSVSYINFYKLFKAAIIGVHCDPDMYSLHAPKVCGDVAPAHRGADLRDVEARAEFAPNSGMTERYSRK